jgi:hypothetical protein
LQTLSADMATITAREADQIERANETGLTPVVFITDSGSCRAGLLTQILAGRGLAAASVAVDPAPFRGVLSIPFSALKAARPVLGNPAKRNRAVPLS